MEEQPQPDAIADNDNEYDALHDSLDAVAKKNPEPSTNDGDIKKEHRRGSRSPSPRRRRQSRSPSRDRHRRPRSRSRDRNRHRSSRQRSPSYTRRHYRPRSRDRDHRRRRSPDRRPPPRRNYSPDGNYGGYAARRGDARKMRSLEDPFAKLRSTAQPATDPALAARQMQEQQLKARHAVLRQQAASAVTNAKKVRREVYVGNLIAGVVDEAMIRELFKTTLAQAFPELCQNAGGKHPVISVNMAPCGKFCFMELITSELAMASLALTGQVFLMGATLSIGLPTGYLDPARAQAAALSSAEALARFEAEVDAAHEKGAIDIENVKGPGWSRGGTNGGDDNDAQKETSFLALEGMVSVDTLKNETECAEVAEEIKSEFDRHGTVLRVIIPRPDDVSLVDELMGTQSYGKVLVQFLDEQGAKAAKDAVDGRLFAGQVVKGVYLKANDFIEALGV